MGSVKPNSNNKPQTALFKQQIDLFSPPWAKLAFDKSLHQLAYISIYNSL